MPAPPSLWELTAAGGLESRFLADAATRIPLAGLANGTSLGLEPRALRGYVVLLQVRRQLAAALALLELDGIAARIVLCPPGLAPAQLEEIAAKAGADIVLTDDPALTDIAGIPAARCGEPVRPAAPPAHGAHTEWLLFTSGTTGTPKMVVHSLASLTGAVRNDTKVQNRAVWSTFYDIRRYGGLQILLRALTGGGAIVLSDGDGLPEFLQRAAAEGVSHISGTPSHWRRALMTAELQRLAPAYVRLSGEIADQIILNRLREAFPAAAISHAFASTEAGVGFDVQDGLAGFPAEWVDAPGEVQLRVKDGSLHIRSARNAAGYAGEACGLKDADGFIDTGDLVELRDGRYHFTGRREGVINVGGLKVHPEAVEAVINRHPQVRMSRVRARRSPITGAIVVAEIVRRNQEAGFPPLRDEILQLCRQSLAPHMVPAFISEVASLELSAAGKLLRRGG